MVGLNPIMSIIILNENNVNTPLEGRHYKVGENRKTQLYAAYKKPLLKTKTQVN